MHKVKDLILISIIQCNINKVRYRINWRKVKIFLRFQIDHKLKVKLLQKSIKIMNKKWLKNKL